MIKEIKKPNIDFKIPIIKGDKFYYDENNKEYFLVDKYGWKYYFNLKGKYHRIEKPAIVYSNAEAAWIEDGKWHRLDGAAYIYENYKEFYIKNIEYNEYNFGKKTNHLICKLCRKFCKQECF